MDDRPLTPKDITLLDAYLATGSIPAAAAAVGVDRTTAWRRAKAPAFQQELARRTAELSREARAGLLARQAAAWAAIDDVLGGGNDPLRIRVATWLLDHSLAHADATSAPSAVDVELEAAEREAVARLRRIGDGR